MNYLEKILTDAELKADLIKVLNLAIHDFEYNQCFWAYNNLSRLQKDLSPNVKKDFEADFSDILIKLKWIALSRFNKKELIDLLERNLLITKELFLDVFVLKEEIRCYLLGIINYEDRNELKLEIRNALLRNKEIINSDSPIKTIGDWLRDMTSIIGQGIADNLKETEYYLNNKNFKALEKEDQVLLKQVISLYKFCWYSSQTPEGLEESINVVENGKYYTLEQGQMSEVKKFDPETMVVIKSFINEGKPRTISGSASVSKLQEHYHTILNKLINKEKHNVLISGVKPVSVILDELNSNLALKDQTGVLAGLESLILAKGFDKVLKDKNQSQVLLAYLKSRLNVATPELIKKLEPEVLSLYLQSVFVEKLSLNPEEAAILSLYLANKLAKEGKKEYLNMIYGDTKSGNFKWRNIKVEGDKLLFE